MSGSTLGQCGPPTESEKVEIPILMLSAVLISDSCAMSLLVQQLHGTLYFGLDEQWLFTYVMPHYMNIYVYNVYSNLKVQFMLNSDS